MFNLKESSIKRRKLHADFDADPKILLGELNWPRLQSLPPVNELKCTKFWNSLAQLKAKDQILKFTDIPPFFPDGMTALLIRESYVGLFEKIIDNLSRKLHRMAISGNPGIGKSLFLFYVMWRLSFMENVGTVVLRRAKDNEKIYIFTKSRCWYIMGNNKEFDDILGLRDTWYLTDNLLPVPGEVKAVTILVSSSSRKYYADFIKYSATDSLRYLPVWTFEELITASTLYESMSLDLVKERYFLIGGIPRFVLEKFDENLKDIIEEAISRLDIDKIHSILNGFRQNENDINHKIVHFVVNDSFGMVTLQFSSIYVTNRALDFLSINQEEKLRNFIFGG